MKKYELNLSDDNLKQTIEDDVLGRNQKIVNLIKLINNINENFIISIDGNWGTGKTFFVKQLMYIVNNFIMINNPIIRGNEQLIADFQKQNLLVYYNAWENDDHQSPLESFIFNILNEYPSWKNEVENPEDKFLLFKDALAKIVEKGSLGIFTKESFDQLKSFSDLADSINTIEEKKEALNKLLNMITVDKRILLIVDELDRCRPDYAVSVLETIKHFYNNPNITILVVTNNNQLSSTIKHFYGYDFDGYGYLNKIYDTVITLKTENLDEYTKSCCNIMKSSYLPENISNLLFHYFDFSYRECNKYMSMYRIIEPYTKHEYFDKRRGAVEASIFLPIAIAMKIKNIDLYNDFVSGKSSEFFVKFFDKSFLDNVNIEYYDWFSDIFRDKDNDNLISCAQGMYLHLFSNKRGYFEFPYMDVLSMLGNMIDF